MKELLYNTALETGINLTDIQLEKFQIYYNLLIETNKVMNLTSITEEKDVVLKHFIDSLAIKNYIDISNGRVIDIGTGAGFPGIPLAIIYNDTQFTLMDSLNKRINFINTVMEECKLYNIETVHSRAEDLGHNNVYREKYDYCVSRAVAAIPVLLEYCIPFLKTGGKFISYKSYKIIVFFISNHFKAPAILPTLDCVPAVSNRIVEINPAFSQSLVKTHFI